VTTLLPYSCTHPPTHSLTYSLARLSLVPILVPLHARPSNLPSSATVVL